MRPLSRRAFIAALSALGGAVASEKGIGSQSAENQKEWPTVERAAREFVARETTEHNWPFEAITLRDLDTGYRQVWLHYFSPLPLSLDNLPDTRDYYHDSGTRRTGEGGKYANKGGYLRDRPLSPAPWPTSNWRLCDAAIDLMRAQRIGADGFMLDIDWLNADGQLHDIMEALSEAADRITPKMHIVAQPDMASLATQGPAELAAYIAHAASIHESFYRLPDGRLLVAPFAPDIRPVDFWIAFISAMRNNGQPVALLPVMLNLARVAPFIPISHGLSSWGTREPRGATELANHLQNAAQQANTWMMPIAPQDSRPNSSIFWEAGNTRLFRSLWAAAIETKAPQVHLLTWNDFGESTQIEPSFATQFVFYDLAAYFIATYKLGRAPTILRDAIYYTHRRQIARADHPAVAGDVPMKYIGDSGVSNDVEMLAFLTAPAILDITLSGKSIQSVAKAGLVELRAPALPGRPRFRIIRDQQVVVELLSAWDIVARPERDDFTYYGGCSTRQPTRNTNTVGEL